MPGHAHSRRTRAGRALATALVLWLGGMTATALTARAVPPPLAATAQADIKGEAARLVITPSTKIDYSLHGDAEGLVLEFGVPVDIDMHPALRRLRPFIDRADVADGGRRIVLHFATALAARSWYHGTSIVVALTPAPAAQPKPAATPPTATAPARADAAEPAATAAADASAPLDEEALREIARRKAIEAAQAAKARRQGTAQPTAEASTGLPSVAVEGDSGADYGRLVFDWPNDVAYTVRREPGDEAVVAFMRPADLDIDAVSRALPRNVLALRAHLQNGVSVVWMKLAKGATLRDARDGSRVVLYIEQKGAAAGPAPAAPTTGPRVRLTSSEGDGYTRLVFDWPKRTSYRFRVDGDQAVITFARPGRIDLDKLTHKLPRNVAGLQAETGANGGLAVRITLAPGATIADKRQGRKVALTIADPPAAKTARAAAPEGEAPAAPAKPEFLPPDQSDALFAAAALPPDFAPLELPAAPLEMVSGSAQRADAAAGDAAEPPYPAATGDHALPVPVPAPKPAAFAQADSAAAPDAIAEDEPAPAPEAAPSPETASASGEPAAPAVAAPQQQVASAPAIPVEPADLTPVRIKVDGPAATLRVALPKARTAAAFQRAGQTWVVFDWPVHMELSLVRLAKHPAIGTVRQLPSPDASVLLFTGSTAAPRLSREGEDWVIELRDQAAKPNLSIPLKPAPDASALVLDVEHPGETLRLADPEVGDSLLVTPVETPGLGVADGINWPTFRVLPTIQGIAVAPLADAVQVVSAPQGVTVAAAPGLPARGPSGAEEPAPVAAPVPAEAVVAAAPAPADRAAPASEAPASEAPVAAAEEAAVAPVVTAPARVRLFRLAAWRHGGTATLVQDRQALQQAIAAAPPEEQDTARLELARFFFAHGLMAEARGMLELIAPQGTTDPEITLMQAAASLVLGDDKAAEPLLARPALDGEPEAKLWRGVLSAHKGAWEAAASDFADTAPLIADYPKAVRTRLRLLAAEARIQIGDPLLAGEFMDALRADDPDESTRAELGFLEGLRAARVGKLHEAEKQWEQVKDSADPKVRARTLYELTLVQLKDGSITPAEAIERLEEARFLWRGGPLELAVTRRLADLYLQQGEARKGLSLLRAAAAEFADSPEAPAIAQRMTQAFEDLYLNGGADRLKPLSAVALFQEFRELMPAGEKGDRMIATLADRMVKVDLLDQAAALLEEQVKTRLQGVGRARVGARLAAIRLLDRKPDAALEALKISDGPDLPGQLAAERRRLEARARLDKGQGDVALALIAGDDSPDGLLLRVDIAWRGQKWADAAAAIGALVEARGEDPAKLSAEGEQLVLNRAVALSLAADHDGLKALRDRYGDSMAAGPFADAFALLTSDFAEADALKPVAEQLKGVEQVEGFLAAYRKRLQLASLSDRATERPTPAP